MATEEYISQLHSDCVWMAQFLLMCRALFFVTGIDRSSL